MPDQPHLLVAEDAEETAVFLSRILDDHGYTGQEEPKENEGDVVARQLGSVLGESLRDLATDGLVEKPISPPTLIHQIQNFLYWRTTDPSPSSLASR